MSYDRAQVREAAERRDIARTREALPQLRAMQAQAPLMAALVTGNDAWDRYHSFLQDLTNKAKAQKEAAHAKLADPGIWDPQQLSKLKSDILQADAMVQAWELAMQLPRALIEDGQKAGDLIVEFEKKHETSAAPGP